MKKKIRTVSLNDTSPLLRAGFRHYLDGCAGFRVLAETASGREAYRLFAAQQPDVVVLSLAMGDMSGLEVSRRMLARHATASIVVVSPHCSIVWVEQAMRLGVMGYVSQSIARSEFVEALETVAEGGRYVEPRTAQRYALARIQREGDAGITGLSAREFEVFRLCAEGRSSSEIAEALDLSVKTVANYASGIKSKLGVTTTAAMTRLALQHGVIGD